MKYHTELVKLQQRGVHGQWPILQHEGALIDKRDKEYHLLDACEGVHHTPLHNNVAHLQCQSDKHIPRVVGHVSSCMPHRDKETAKSRGFAFLAYEDQRSTVLAVDNLSGSRVAGRIIRVDHVDNYKVKRAEVGTASFCLCHVVVGLGGAESAYVAGMQGVPTHQLQPLKHVKAALHAAGHCLECAQLVHAQTCPWTWLHATKWCCKAQLLIWTGGGAAGVGLRRRRGHGRGGSGGCGSCSAHGGRHCGAHRHRQGRR